MGRSERTVEARIIGRVQGVSFRWWTREQARSLHLSGWVRNERDGAVTALIHGPAQAVGTMIERLRQGPPMASVRDVEIHDIDPVETDGEFRITD